MAGWSNSDNKFGPSKYVVGTILGDGCNYTSIQAAINDAIAAGNNAVYIRPGVYTENLSIAKDVTLIGATGPQTGCSVIIKGQTTVVNGLINFTNLYFAPVGADVAISIDVVGYVILSCTGCVINGTGSISQAIHFRAGAAEARFTDCTIRANSIGAIVDDIGAFIEMESCFVIASGTALAYKTNASGYQYYIESCTTEVFGQEIHNSNGVGGFISRFSRFNNGGSGLEAFNLTNAGAIVNLASCEVQCSTGSGDWITGIGTLSYGNVVLSSTAKNINIGISVTDFSVRPYAISAIFPGTGIARGSSCFDSSQFTVTNGFVQTSFSGIFPTIDQAISTSVLSNTRNMGTAAVTLTLPAAPVQGDVCSFVDTIGGVLTIQTSGTQKVEINNAFSTAGGTATSSAQGDNVTLVYQSSTDTWWCEGSALGLWVLT